MKLLDVLDLTNTIEKSSFYKILNNLIEAGENEEIEDILNDRRQVKEIGHANIIKVFTLLREDYKKHIQLELASNLSQLDILIDILIRDGNVILKDRWFHDLYRIELEKINESSKNLLDLINSDSKLKNLAEVVLAK